MSSTSAHDFYTKKGYIRVRVKVEKEVLPTLKLLAIDEDTSVIKVLEEAVLWTLRNISMLPETFHPPSDAVIFSTFIKKDSHKKLKKIALVMDKPLVDLVGFIATVWSKAYGKT